MKFYLEQLITALHDDDVARLSNMDLKRSKIKLYFEMLIDSRKTVMPGKEAVMEKLDLDENSFRKMRSVALTKSLNELVPEGGAKLLHFLSRYRLHEMFWREADEIITRMEAEKSTTADEKAKVYLQSIQGYMRLPFTLYESEKLKVYLKGFQANYSNPDKEVIINLISINELFILIVQSFLRMDLSESNGAKFLKAITAIEQKSEKLKNSRLNIFTKGIHLIFDFYYKPGGNQHPEAFAQLLNEYAALENKGSDDEILAIRFYRAYSHMMLNDFKEANRLFAQMGEKHERIYMHFPHVTMRYALSMLMAGDGHGCRKLLNSSLRKNVLAYDADSTIMSCLAYTAYHLMEDETEEAQQYINLYQTVRNKKDLLSFETAMRLFEIVYFFQRGDAAFANEQLKKFARYLDDKSELVGIKNVIVLVKRLSIIFNNLVTDKISLAGFESEIEKLFNGNYTLMSILFINAAKLRSGSFVIKPANRRIVA